MRNKSSLLILVFILVCNLVIKASLISTGKGIWIWKIWETENGNVDTIISKLSSSGVKWVVIKIGDSDSYYNESGKKLYGWSSRYGGFDSVITQFHNNGIKVFGWHFVYSYNKWGTGTTETSVSNLILNIQGIDGLVINAEADYEGQGKGVIAKQYMQNIRLSHPSDFITLSSFARVTGHEWLPWIEFLQYCDVNMPQAYWAARPLLPDQEVSNMKADFDYWNNIWQNSGYGSSIKPTVPTGQGGQLESGRNVYSGEVSTFCSTVKRNGYQGVSLYAYHIMSANSWNEYTLAWSTTTPTLSITSIDPSSIQTKDWGQSVTWTITVKDGDGNPISGATVGGSDNVQQRSFQTSATNSSGVTTYTTTVPSGNANGTYDITFSAFKSGYTQSATLTRQVQVSHSTLSLSIPILSSPSNGATGISVNPSLAWNAVNNATSYRLQVSTYSNFSSVNILDQANIQTTSYQVNLSNDTKYYWRVNASNSNTTSSWSETWNFTTVPQIAAPILSSPSNGATGISINPTLSWNAVTGATYYHLQVSTYSDFSVVDVLDQPSIQNTSYPVGADYSKTYYWRVSASNSTLTSDWSSIWSFTTKPTSSLWTVVYNGGSYLMGVFFTDANTGWVVGSSSTILHTTDSGSNWTNQTSPVSFCSFYSVYFSDKNNGWIVGINNNTQGGIIIHTTNGGISWTVQYEGEGSSITRVWWITGLNDKVLYAAWNNGLLYTTDGGNTWQTKIMDRLWRVRINDVNNILAATISGKILLSADRGNNWITKYTPSNGGAVLDVASIGSNVWGVGSLPYFKIEYSSNLGSTWVEQNAGVPDLRSATFLNSNYGWAVGGGGKILSTINGGQNWNIISSPTTSLLHDVFFTNSIGWAVGEPGIIIKYTDTTQTFTVSCTANPSTGGNVYGSGNFAKGRLVKVTAIPNDGWQFVDWTENGARVSTDSIYQFTISSSRNLTANFQQRVPTIHLSQTTLSFGNVQVNTNSASQSYTVSGSNLTTSITISTPSGFQISRDSSTGFVNSLTISSAGGSVTTSRIYVLTFDI